MSLFAFGGETFPSNTNDALTSDTYLNPSRPLNSTHKYLSDDQVFTIKDMMNSLGMAPTKQTDQDNGLEYLFEDGGTAVAHRQSFGSRLAYGTGIIYLSGLAFGGMWGLSEGLLFPGKHSTRTRWNMILNTCTRRGPFIANNLGLIALFYNGLHGGLLKALDRDSDLLTTTGCASLAGAIVRSSAGVKPALVASLVTGSSMAIFDIIRNFKEYSSNLSQYFNKAY